MGNKGGVTLIHKEQECDVEWKMDFLSLSREVGKGYWSPLFNFGGESWWLVMYLNGREDTDSIGYMDLRLSKVTANRPPTNMEVTFALKTVNGEKDPEIQRTGVFEGEKFEICRFISKSDFEKKRSEFLSSGFLTVVCTLRRIISAAIASGIRAASCSYCNETFDVGILSSHEKKCLYKPIKCPTCSDAVLLMNWYEHECQKERTQELEKLSDDLKDMMVNAYHSDIIIEVKGEKFRLHKNILGARSGYFNSMFSSNMKEMKTGLVPIDDCEPDVFRSFIHYLYTGKVIKLTPENVCGLYDISDKYKEVQLKEICLRFMMNSITIDSLSDFFILAMRHDEGDSEKKLIEKAAKYFADNTKEIIRSEKWLAFMKKYPEYSVALHTKALDAHSEDDDSS